MGTGREFNAALSNFMFDFASGGAIRHLADLGYTVTEIKERLSFPTPKDRVAQAVWKHYLDTGKIACEKPVDTGVIEKVSYVREYGQFGKPTMKRVVEKCEVEKKTYLSCDFGKKRYKDPEGFERELEQLNPRDRQYILDLPWPLEEVYHEADERMVRIMKRLRRDMEDV